MAKGSGNPAGKQPPSRNAKPYDANNVSSLASARDPRGMSEFVGRTTPFFPRGTVSEPTRQSCQHQTSIPRRKASRTSALSLRRPSAKYLRCHGGYVSVPDNLNLSVPTVQIAPRYCAIVQACAMAC